MGERRGMAEAPCAVVMMMKAISVRSRSALWTRLLRESRCLQCIIPIF